MAAQTFIQPGFRFAGNHLGHGRVTVKRPLRHKHAFHVNLRHHKGAALGNRQRVGTGAGQVGKGGAHLFRAFQAVVRRQRAPGRVVHGGAIANAQQHVRCGHIISRNKPHIVGGHNRQLVRLRMLQ